MHDTTRPTAADLLLAYRTGNADAGGELIERYRNWLRLLARLEIDTHYRGKFDESDVAQAAALEALRDMGRFRGETEAEFTAWMRRILAHCLAREFRRYRGTRKRDVALEVSLDRTLGDASRRLGDILASPASSPSHRAAVAERDVALAEVLGRLPDDHREVIILRNLEGLAHEEVASRMGRSTAAVRMLWLRALAGLRQELGVPPDGLAEDATS